MADVRLAVESAAENLSGTLMFFGNWIINGERGDLREISVLVP